MCPLHSDPFILQQCSGDSEEFLQQIHSVTAPDTVFKKNKKNIINSLL